MNILGVNLTLLIGPTVAVPALPPLTEAVESVEVIHSDEGRSVFQITFRVGRGGVFGAVDYPLLNSPLLRPFNRVILLVRFDVVPKVLMDGFITHQQLLPSNEPGASTLIITGEDVSVKMDLEEKVVEHPAQDDTTIVNKIIASYTQYGLLLMVTPPPVVDPPNPTERVPVQHGTDLEYLQKLAQRYAYVFYVTPGPAPAASTAYWGPPQRLGLPQRALSVNLGSETNVESISFVHDALAPTLVSGRVQDRTSNQSLPVETYASARLPLSSQPTSMLHRANVRRVQFRQTGLSVTGAFARAQAMTDASNDAVTAQGELDTLRYGGLLQARSLVGLRGAGYSYDGFYYVKRVTHKISKGQYKQHFTLMREGIGALSPTVIP